MNTQLPKLPAEAAPSLVPQVCTAATMGGDEKETVSWQRRSRRHVGRSCGIRPQDVHGRSSFSVRLFPDGLKNFLSTGEIAKYDNGPELRRRFPLAKSNLKGNQRLLSLRCRWNETSVLLGFFFFFFFWIIVFLPGSKLFLRVKSTEDFIILIAASNYEETSYF